MRFASPANADVTQRLLNSAEPSIRLQVVTDLLGRPADNRDVRRLREQVRTSSRVATLLSERGRDGTHPASSIPAKVVRRAGVLVALGELRYPTGDESLLPLRDQIMSWLFSSDYERNMGRAHGLPTLYAPIDGNAVRSALSLGIADDRIEPLVQRLLDTQWPDGGWNCDGRASGRSSSFTESLIPLRALALHTRLTGDERSHLAAERASEFFLAHRLFRRRHGGWVVAPAYLQLHYPCYWHYDILFGLEVLAEADT